MNVDAILAQARYGIEKLKLKIMTKYASVSMFISSSILLILKLTDLKEINTMTILEITFYIGIIIYTTYIFLKFKKLSKQETK